MKNKIRWISNGSVSFYTINKVGFNGRTYDSMLRPAGGNIDYPLVVPHLQENKIPQNHLDLVEVDGSSDKYCGDVPIHIGSEVLPVSTTVIPFRRDIKDKVKTVFVCLKEGSNNTNLCINVDYDGKSLSVSTNEKCWVNLWYYNKPVNEMEFKIKQK